MTFRHNIAGIANSFVVPLDIPVMPRNDILQKKMLNAMYFYRFHNDVTVKNSSLSSQSNEL